jgi:hypothetical protein
VVSPTVVKQRACSPPPGSGVLSLDGTKEPDMQDTSKNKKKAPKNGIEGEGSYSGTRDYNQRTAQFIKEGKVDKAAKEAERAMESDEAAELKKAEAQGKAGDIRGKRKSK